MQSIREQIIQTVVARLTLVASAQGATIRRQPTVPTDRAQLPTLLVFPDSEAVRRVNDRTERELVIRIVALAVGTATEIPEPMADRLIRFKNGRVESETVQQNPVPIETIEW